MDCFMENESQKRDDAKSKEDAKMLLRIITLLVIIAMKIV